MPNFEIGNWAGPLVQIAAVALIAGALNFGYWYQLDREKKSIDVQMRVAEQKNRELADIKVRFLERQKQAEAYKRRVDVIDQLRANQTGPVALLSMIGDTVNGTEAVWLNSMQDQGASVAIDGTALSSDAVANLISNLQKTGFFRNIEIKETFQDDGVKDMQAFQFTLTCEKAKS
jgi:Tfp pilus assembly protein PilN